MADFLGVFKVEGSDALKNFKVGLLNDLGWINGVLPATQRRGGMSIAQSALGALAETRRGQTAVGRPEILLLEAPCNSAGNPQLDVTALFGPSFLPGNHSSNNFTR